MSDSNNSALMALAELQRLEDERHSEIAAREAAARAQTERIARLAAEKAERERIAAEQEARARADAEREAESVRRREEAARIEAAAAAALAEHEARLAEEEARIDAEIRRAQRRAAPKWPLLAVPMLLLAGIGLGGFGWMSKQQAERTAKHNDNAQMLYAEAGERHEDALAEIHGMVGDLEDERDRLEAKVTELTTVADRAEAERAREEAAAAAEAAEKAAAEAAKSKTKSTKSTKTKKKTTSKSKPKPKPKAEPKPKPEEVEPPTPGRKDRIELGDSLDPLAGL